VLACTIDRVKYRPRRSCSVAYRLQLVDAHAGHPFEQRVSARFCSGSESLRRHEQATLRTAVHSAAGPALTHLPTLGMVAHWLPNDAKLAAVPLLLSDAKLRSHCLPGVVAALTGGRGRLVDHHTTLVQLVPELRVCARVELHVQGEPASGTGAHTLYAKADAERSAAATHAAMRALSDGAAASPGRRLQTPRSLLWQAAAGLHWQLGVPGEPLDALAPHVDPILAARVGAQLATLHATPVGGLTRLDADTLRAQVRNAATWLSQVEPAWHPLLARLADRLDADAALPAREPAVTLHGDLHPRNIVVDGAELAFIDLDGMRSGPAVCELGAWVADGLYRAMLDGVEPQHALHAGRAFLAAYAAASGRLIDGPSVAWSAAHDLLCKRAYRCVANLKPGRFEIVPRLLSLADAIAAAGRIDAAAEPAREPA
jgi:aminoglycoside phosphotransferase (APT) family kinase protein